MINVIICDDHPLIRRGLSDLLSDSPDLNVTGEASSAAEVLEMVRRRACDVVLLDITMHGRSGLDALHDIKGEKPDLPVLMLSTHPEDQFALRSIRSGASGYLTKETAPDELINAIHKVVAGGRYVSAALAEQMAARISGVSPENLHEVLSDREYDVLRALGRGRTVTQIAEELSLSVKTVSTYRTRILDKLKLETTADLIRYALEHHLSE